MTIAHNPTQAISAQHVKGLLCHLLWCISHAPIAVSASRFPRIKFLPALNGLSARNVKPLLMFPSQPLLRYQYLKRQQHLLHKHLHRHLPPRQLQRPNLLHKRRLSRPKNRKSSPSHAPIATSRATYPTTKFRHEPSRCNASSVKKSSLLMAPPKPRSRLTLQSKQLLRAINPHPLAAKRPPSPPATRQIPHRCAPSSQTSRNSFRAALRFSSAAS